MNQEQKVTATKSISLPIQLLMEVDNLRFETKQTFSGFVSSALELYIKLIKDRTNDNNE